MNQCHLLVVAEMLTDPMELVHLQILILVLVLESMPFIVVLSWAVPLLVHSYTHVFVDPKLFLVDPSLLAF